MTGVVEGVRKGIRVDGEEIELHLAVRYGVSIPAVGAAVQAHVAAYLEQMTDVRPAAVHVVVDEVDGLPRLTGLTRLTLETAPSRLPRLRLVAVARLAARDRQNALDGRGSRKSFGAFGTVYYGDDGRTLGRAPVRAGAARSRTPTSCRPARPPTTRCSSPAPTSPTSRAPWVLQSLFLAAIGEARDRGVASVEAFACRYPEGESARERFLAQDGLPGRLPRRLRLPDRADAGSDRPRAARARRPAARRGGPARGVLRVVKEAFLPEPVPAPRP